MISLHLLVGHPRKQAGLAHEGGDEQDLCRVH